LIVEFQVLLQQLCTISLWIKPSAITGNNDIFISRVCGKLLVGIFGML